MQIIAHCREYGNLNARAWPEKIAHENALTMAALARTSEDFMLDRIKALSVNVTNGAETLGALIYLVDAIVKAAFGIRGTLADARATHASGRCCRAVALDMLLLDTIQTQFDRFQLARGHRPRTCARSGSTPCTTSTALRRRHDQLAGRSTGGAAIDALPGHDPVGHLPRGRVPRDRHGRAGARDRA